METTAEDKLFLWRWWREGSRRLARAPGKLAMPMTGEQKPELSSEKPKERMMPKAPVLTRVWIVVQNAQ